MSRIQQPITGITDPLQADNFIFFGLGLSKIYLELTLSCASVSILNVTMEFFILSKRVQSGLPLLSVVFIVILFKSVFKTYSF